MQPIEDASRTILSTGVVGAVAVVLAAALLLLWRRYDSVVQKRHEELIDIVKAQAQISTNSTNAIQRNTETLEKLDETLSDHTNALNEQMAEARVRNPMRSRQ